MHTPRRRYYFMLCAVVLIWGIDPVVNRYFYGYYSASALCALSTFASAVLFLFLARASLSRENLADARAALPICVCNSLACVLQRIGLQYTTPARYAFFEHLSCVTVPFLLFICFRKKPSALQALSAALCLLGCLLLAGEGAVRGSFGIGDVLCILAGILLGTGIVFALRCTGKIDIRFFTAMHMSVYFLTSLFLTLALHFIPSQGAPIEEIRFALSPLPLLGAVLFGLLSVGLCWMLRNEVARRLCPTFVAVFSPLSAVITAAISTLLGLERATPAFLLACLMIFCAPILAGLGEEKMKKMPASPQRED